MADRERRFRKQRSSARQNPSPTSVVQCHGARTRLGPRGGGRLRVLSTDAVAPTSIVCFTGTPGRPRPPHGARTRFTMHGEARLLKRTIASDATYSVTDNRIASVGTAELRRQRISHASSGRRAEDAVDRVVELVRGSNPASPCGWPRLSAKCAAQREVADLKVGTTLEQAVLRKVADLKVGTT